jgi:hypothetical protein
MLQRCRPAGRLFCLVLAIAAGAWGAVTCAGEKALAATPRISAAAKPLAEPAPRAASPTPQSGPALTNVIDATAYGLDMPGMLALALTKAYELKICLTAIAAKTDSADPNLTTLNDVLASLT